MERYQKIEEGLSIIWEEREKNNNEVERIRKRMVDDIRDDVLIDLEKDEYVAIAGQAVKLTPFGEETARDVIRRERLAERLLIDVLEVSRQAMDSSACELEHILSKDVEESICILLGHPRECPHGLPIPPGSCCAKAKEMIESVVVPLSRLSPGESSRIVYVLTRQHPQLHKLMSLGVVPGTRVVVHQTFPSFVIQVEETQLALEENIAREIYVKRASKSG